MIFSCQLTYLLPPSCPLSKLLPTTLITHMLICPPTYLVYTPNYLPTYPPTYPPTYLNDLLSLPFTAYLHMMTNYVPPPTYLRTWLLVTPTQPKVTIKDDAKMKPHVSIANNLYCHLLEQYLGSKWKHKTKFECEASFINMIFSKFAFILMHNV